MRAAAKADTSGNVAEDVVMLAAKALTEKRAATLAEHFEHALVCKSAEAELKELGQRAAYVTLLKKEAIVTEDYAGAEAAKAQLDAIRAQAEAAYARIGDASTSLVCVLCGTNKEKAAAAAAAGKGKKPGSSGKPPSERGAPTAKRTTVKKGKAAAPPEDSAALLRVEELMYRRAGMF